MPVNDLNLLKADIEELLDLCGQDIFTDAHEYAGRVERVGLLVACIRDGEAAPASRDDIVLYECGICGYLHPWGFDGDCRDNSNRYADVDEYRERNSLDHISSEDVEVRTYDERLMAAEEGE